MSPAFEPMSPTIPDVAAFATAPTLVKSAKLATVPKMLLLQLLTQEIGIVIGPIGKDASPGPKVMAPSEESILPSRVLPAATVMAPG